ncbi:outer membrane secretin SsaC, partial [Salmonella enterica subsp. enterica serovar Enteritidis str. 50-5646]
MDTDFRGYAVVPYASPYHRNEVSLDTTGIRKNIELIDTSKTLVPTRGAVVRAEYISVKIIDVNAGDINQLGIDWGTAVSLGGKKIAFNTGLNDGGASGFSTVISDTSNFMVRLNAL